jgi:hypothetical protein
MANAGEMRGGTGGNTCERSRIRAPRIATSGFGDRTRTTLKLGILSCVLGGLGCQTSGAAAQDAPLSVDAPLSDEPPIDAQTIDGSVLDAALPDADGVDAVETLLARCQRLRREWAAEVDGVDVSCQAPTDCQAVGYTRYPDEPTCDCIASIAGSGAHAIHAGMYTARAMALETEFVNDCVPISDDLGWLCDEGFPDVFCTAGRCEARGSQYCL